MEGQRGAREATHSRQVGSGKADGDNVPGVDGEWDDPILLQDISRSDVDRESRDNALEVDQRDDEPRGKNKEERWQTYMRLPWNVAYRIMRLATTNTDGKIHRTIDGLPIGLCLANKSDVLSKAAAARRKSEPGVVAVAEPQDSSAGGGAIGFDGEQRRVASSSPGNQQRVERTQKEKTHWITYLEDVQADCVAQVKDLEACGWRINRVVWRSTGFEVECRYLEGKSGTFFFPESKHIGHDLARVETPSTLPERHLGAASAAEVELTASSDASGVAGNVAGQPQTSGRGPRRLQLKSGVTSNAVVVIEISSPILE